MLMKTYDNFQDFYQKNKTNEWKKIYIDYDLLESITDNFKLKSDLHKKIKNQQVVPIDDEEDNQIFLLLTRLNTEFIQLFHREMTKCNEFFVHHLKAVKAKFIKLSWNIMVLKEEKTKGPQEKETFTLCECTKTLYKETYLLQRFCEMNKEAANRINQRYQMRAFFLPDHKQNLYKIQKKISNFEIFQESFELKQILDEVKLMNIKNFSMKNPEEGIAQLKAQVKTINLPTQTILQFGIFIGLTFCFLFIIIINRINLVAHKNFKYDLYFPVFRGIGLFIFYFWLLTCNVYIWNKCHINYKLIYSFNYHYSTVVIQLRRITLFTLMYLVLFYISLFKEIQDLDYNLHPNYKNISITTIFPFEPQYGPLILWVFILCYACMPFKIFNYQGRLYFWRLAFKAITCAFRMVNFSIVWFIIQLLALIGPIKDLYYTFCIYTSLNNQQEQKECGSSKNITTGLVIALTPTIMIMICQIQQARMKGKFFGTDQSLNFLRLSFSACTTICSFVSKYYPAFFYLWIGMAAINTMTAYYWDVVKSWGFFAPDTKYRFLRKQLAYDWPEFYYAVMVVNIPLRMSWTLSISPNNLDLWSPLFVLVMSAIQIFRIFLWNFIRVEKEHVNVIGEFKVVPKMVFPYEIDKYLQQKQSNADSTTLSNLLTDLKLPKLANEQLSTLQKSQIQPISIQNSDSQFQDYEEYGILLESIKGDFSDFKKQILNQKEDDVKKVYIQQLIRQIQKKN